MNISCLDASKEVRENIKKWGNSANLGWRACRLEWPNSVNSLWGATSYLLAARATTTTMPKERNEKKNNAIAYSRPNNSKKIHWEKYKNRKKKLMKM